MLRDPADPGLAPLGLRNKANRDFWRTETWITSGEMKYLHSFLCVFWSSFHHIWEGYQASRVNLSRSGHFQGWAGSAKNIQISKNRNFQKHIFQNFTIFFISFKRRRYSTERNAEAGPTFGRLAPLRSASSWPNVGSRGLCFLRASARVSSATLTLRSENFNNK